MKYSVCIDGASYVAKVVGNGYEHRETKRSVVAFHGPCRVEAPREDFFACEESEPYVGPVLESPTWGRLFREAKSQQRTTKDWHHDFFEGARVLKIVGGVKVIELLLGS
jgi:hypothetical protein